MTTFEVFSNAEPSTSVSLLDQARGGEPDAWERIVRIYGPVVYTWARRAGRQRADAADVVQDVFTDAARNLQQLRIGGKGTTFRGWLWTITRRRLVDQTRVWARQPRQATEEQIAETLDPQSNLLDPPTDAGTDLHSVLASALAGLGRRFEADTIEAFRRVMLEGQDPGDVASDLGMSRWSVYKAKSRVLHCLRTELKGLID